MATADSRAPARARPWQGGLLLCGAALLLCISLPTEPLLRMLNPALPAPSTDGRAQPAARLLQHLEASHPALRVYRLTLPAAPGRFAQVYYTDGHSPRPRHALADPVSGALHTTPLRGQHWLTRAETAGQRLRRTLGAPLPATLLVLLAYGLLLRHFLRGNKAQTPDIIAPDAAANDTMLVCYASQTGGAEALARDTTQRLQDAGRAVQMIALNALDAARLRSAQQALFIVSTHGEGDPPDNAALFARRVLPTHTDLSQLEFGLLALGDSAYDLFCGFGRSLAAWLQQQGARAGFTPVEVDNHDAAALTHWHQQLQYFTASAVPPPSPVKKPTAVHTMTLQHREHLNPGSPGAPAFHISLSAPALPHWVAGDLAVIHIGDARREYSIASLPQGNKERGEAPGSLQLLVRQMHHADGRLGLGSGLLTQSLKVGEAVSLSIRTNRNFHGITQDLPIILIGNGTGLAGLYAHLLERAERGHRQNWLLFGERSAEHDRYHDAALQAWHENGHLTHLDRIFSRGTSPDTGYVQDLLHRHATRLKAWVAAGAHFYVCGSLAMGQGVDSALRQLLGDAEVDTLIQTSRYHRDIY